MRLRRSAWCTSLLLEQAGYTLLTACAEVDCPLAPACTAQELSDRESTLASRESKLAQQHADLADQRAAVELARSRLEADRRQLESREEALAQAQAEVGGLAGLGMAVSRQWLLLGLKLASIFAMVLANLPSCPPHPSSL